MKSRKVNFFMLSLTLKILRIPSRCYYYLLYRQYRLNYDISDSFKFSGRAVELYGDGDIIAGYNSYCGNYCSFQSFKGFFIKIGDNTSISHNVRIYTANRKSVSIINNLHHEANPYSFGNVIIGDNCWIGANVFITEGVTIGNNVVVGANSVVTKNLLPNCVYGGVPAKLIKTALSDE